MNILWLALFFAGVCFGPAFVMWLYDRATTRRDYIRAGIAEAEAYANTAVIGDAEFEAEWARWLEDES